jgi:hypothetical protein
LIVTVAGEKELRLIWTVFVAVDAGVAGAAPTAKTARATKGRRSFFIAT